MTIATANAAIEAYLLRSDALITCSDRVGRAAARELLQTLVDADQEMLRRLNWWIRDRGNGGAVRFSEASLVAYRAQIAPLIRLVQDRLEGITNEVSLRAARVSVGRQSRLFGQLEEAFTGVVRPLRVDETMIMRTRPSLLARHATSVDRYGSAMITRLEQSMAQGMAEGISQFEQVGRLTRMGGPRGMVSMRAVEVQPGMVVRISEELIPEGLFVRHRNWAWRIVRTETAEAQNMVNLDGIEGGRQDFPDMSKKILAMMDNRTAADSIAVHGQIRKTDENFVDGAGRHYLRPPARPNDRETIIPWRAHWSETPRSRVMTESQQRTMLERNAEWQAGQRQRRAAVARARNRRDARNFPPAQPGGTVAASPPH